MFGSRRASLRGLEEENRALREELLESYRSRERIRRQLDEHRVEYIRRLEHELSRLANPGEAGSG